MAKPSSADEPVSPDVSARRRGEERRPREQHRAGAAHATRHKFTTGQICHGDSVRGSSSFGEAKAQGTQ
jgi:hypothetical protein